MKTTLKKITKFFFALLIPAAFLAGCQEDLAEPGSSMPPKSEIKMPPGSK